MESAVLHRPINRLKSRCGDADLYLRVHQWKPPRTAIHTDKKLL